MAIRKYTKNDKKIKLSQNYVVGDFFLNPDFDFILLETELVHILEKLIERFNVKPVFPTKNSGYRTAATNKACGGAKKSIHLTGAALDIKVPGIMDTEVAQYLESLKFNGGIGHYSHGKKGGTIHFDLRGRKARWWIRHSGTNTPGFGGIVTTFKQGQTSVAIELIQTKLNELGFNCGKPDGIFGRKTKNALAEYQRSVGLTADGIFGKKTNKKIKVFEW